MILLVTAIERRDECARAIEQALNEPVAVAETLLQAVIFLRAGAYRAAVFDEQMTQCEPDELDTTLAHLGMALPIPVNLAITGADRLVRDVQSALRWRTHQEASVREVAAESLRRALNNNLTTLLLNCDLALETSGLPTRVTERLSYLHDAAQALRAQLEAGKFTQP